LTHTHLKPYTAAQRIARHVRFCLHAPRNWIFSAIHGLGYDPTWRFFGLPHIFNARGHGRITIGRRFKAISRIANNSVGVFQPVILKCFAGATLRIGDDVGISGSTVSATVRIEIGSRVLIGSGCLITDSDAHPVHPDGRVTGKGRVAPVMIEDDVFLGARCIVLKGVSIGQGSVIGAGSVVSRSIPPFSIAAGNPAQVVGDSRHAPGGASAGARSGSDIEDSP
jgi:acetyltransferase-like isoleucine patch superfamily enzyme